MIYEHQCRAIVMLTRFHESHTEKCAVYFPRHVGRVLSLNQFQVALLEAKDVSRDITVRRFELTHLESHTIMEVRDSLSEHQIQEWSDAGLPLSLS